jgi:hypothetical protein
MLPEENTCVLLRGDGQYHYERLHTRTQRYDVFEGSLAADDLQAIQKVISGDELFSLTQNKIPAPIFQRGHDEVLLSVLRPGSWQNLTFSSPDTRAPFHQSMDYLVKWLHDLPKAPHVAIGEDEGVKNCNPPSSIQLKTRSSAGATPLTSPASPRSTPTVPAPLPKFTLRLQRSKLDSGNGENFCVVVFPQGNYRSEVKKQSIKSKDFTLQVFEGVLDADEIKSLHQILDDPALQSRQSEDPPTSISTSRAEFTTLAVPRGDRVQVLSFQKWFDQMGLGAGRSPGTYDNGTKLLKPLNAWLKANIEAHEQIPIANATETRCSPNAASQP